MFKRPTSHPVPGATAIVVAALLGLLCLASSASATPLERKPFGIEHFTLQTTTPTEVTETGGFRVVNKPYSFTQAGGHPEALTFDVRFTSEEHTSEKIYDGTLVVSHDQTPTQDPKDIVNVLPPGLLGNPDAVPRCSLTAVTSENGGTACSPSTQVGFVRIEHWGWLRKK